jgi:hypothetical protein
MSRRFTPGKGTRYPLYKRLVGPQGRSGRVPKISPPPGFDPRTAQPVASPCTDWAIQAQVKYSWKIFTNRALINAAALREKAERSRKALGHWRNHNSRYVYKRVVSRMKTCVYVALTCVANAFHVKVKINSTRKWFLPLCHSLPPELCAAMLPGKAPASRHL